MRKVISLSALVSGLLAAPGFAAPITGGVRPRSEEVDRGAVVAPELEGGALAAEARDRLQAQLLVMAEKGPEDVGGMRALQRRIVERMQRQMAELLAVEGLKSPKEGMDGLIGDFGWERPLAPVWPQPQGTADEPFSRLPSGAVENFQISTQPVTVVVGQRMEKAAFLGVTTSPVTETLRDQLGLTKGMGLVVDFVAKDSPAEAAGLKVHDVLTKFDDQLVVNIEQLAVLVRSKKDGDAVVLTVIRGGRETKVTAKLVEKDVPVLEEQGTLRFWVPGEAAPRSDNGAAWQQGGHTKVVENADGSTTRTFTDGRGAIIVTQSKEGKASLVARDKDGKEIFSGPYTSDEEKAKVPAEIAERLSSTVVESARIENGTDGSVVIKAGDFKLTAGQLTFSRSDADNEIVLTGNKGNWRVVVKDAKTGKVVYEGAANTEEDFKKMLPESVAEKVRKLEGKADKGP